MEPYSGQDPGMKNEQFKVKQEDQPISYECFPYVSSSFVEVSMADADRSFLNENMRRAHLDSVWNVMGQPKTVSSVLFRSWQDRFDDKLRNGNIDKVSVDEKRQRRLGKQKQNYAHRKLNETPEQREARLKRIREEARRRRYSESQEERMKRLIRLQNYSRQRIMNESEVERALRLSRMRENEKKRRLNESQEQRDVRLRRLRENDKKRRLHESEEQRQRRLSKMKENYKKRKHEKKPVDDLPPEVTPSPAEC